jgi:hypothetical protein
MGYAGKGWWRFPFLVEPEILHQVLKSTRAVLVDTSSRVAVAYESTSLNDYVKGYSEYLDGTLKSADFDQRSSLQIYMGLAASLDQFRPETCPDSRYKLMETDEPVVNLSPLMLYYDDQRGQLRTNVMSSVYFGIELTFPRLISLDREEHEVLHPTLESPNYTVFEEISAKIRKQTHSCRIRSACREHKTQIRITNEMEHRMTRHPGLNGMHLVLVLNS